MDLRTAAQEIRNTVTMEEILGFYGYEVKRGGFMICPFHGDGDPSLKVYRNKNGHSGWHCFGCGRGGSVIDFVKEHEGCDFRTAVRAIDETLKLNLLNAPVNPFREAREASLQRWLDEFTNLIYEDISLIAGSLEMAQETMYKRLKDLESLRVENVQALTAKDWDFIHSWKEEDQYINYRIDKLNEFREEVAAWRRKHRANRKSP